MQHVLEALAQDVLLRSRQQHNVLSTPEHEDARMNHDHTHANHNKDSHAVPNASSRGVANHV